MRTSLKVGFSFGLTSGVITTMGLVVGLYAGTQSFAVAVGGVLTIAIADALSDAMGMHIHEESENAHTSREIWESTAATFFSKLIFSLSFLIPLLTFKTDTAIVVSIAWGLGLVAVLSFLLAKDQKRTAWKIIAEHLGIAVLVVAATHFTGRWIFGLFHG